MTKYEVVIYWSGEDDGAVTGRIGPAFPFER
jgi:hypothetical protein